MAGGIGSRFWPMSRGVHPKQFIDILGTGKTLLQSTFERFIPICPKENIFVVTNETYRSLVLEQLPELKLQNLLCEPARKNTAPCIAYASYKIYSQNNNATIVVAPSDHIITKEKTFTKAIRSCFRKAKSEDCLITLGIRPTRPDTGYGYIQYIESPVPEKDKRIKKVKTFTEKPDIEMAKSFLQSGDFLWNAGIFVWSAKSIIRQYEKLLPDIAQAFASVHYNTPQEEEEIKQVYAHCRNISVDYGILEKADNVYVRSSIIGWSDLGTYSSLYQHIPKDENGNAVVGKHVMLYDSKNCIVNISKDKLVVVEGLQDYIVVESDDIILVCKKQDEQRIRDFVNDVRLKKGEKFV
jgi:mannose-1-phosphate guanylyltransferase